MTITAMAAVWTKFGRDVATLFMQPIPNNRHCRLQSHIAMADSPNAGARANVIAPAMLQTAPAYAKSENHNPKAVAKSNPKRANQTGESGSGRNSRVALQHRGVNALRPVISPSIARQRYR